MRKVTIEDISRETDLSRGTVSRALNNRPDISAETRDRVLEACKKLRYVPSHAARTLATGRNLTIAVFVDDLSAQLSAAMLRGILGTTGPRGYFVHIVELNPRVPAVERIAKVPAERIDAAILVTSLSGDGANSMKTLLEHRPVGLTVRIDGLQGDTFEPDYLEAGRVAGRLLSDRGAKRIAFLERGAMGCAERLRGLREILSQRASTANFEQVEVTAPLDGSSLRQCDAIVLDESPLSLAAIGAIGLGNPSPHFVAFGRDAMLFPLLRECTIIDYAGEEIGRRLSHALLQRIESGPESPPQHVLVAPRIVNPTEDGDR